MGTWGAYVIGDTADATMVRSENISDHYIKSLINQPSFYTLETLAVLLSNKEPKFRTGALLSVTVHSQSFDSLIVLIQYSTVLVFSLLYCFNSCIVTCPAPVCRKCGI